jgi:DNA modification methylase
MTQTATINLASIDTIEIRARQREIDKDIISQLKASILSKGLMHPPVLGEAVDGKPFLVAGMHRLSAIIDLHREGKTFTCSGMEIPLGLTPYTSLHDLSPADLLEAELEENVIRVELAWQDKARALAAIHELRQQENPGQTFKQTATELAQKMGKEKPSGQLRTEVRNATLLAANLHRPSVSKARNATEALGILLKEENAALEAEVIKRRKATAQGVVSPITVQHGDLCQILPTLDAGLFDLIIADLPYGIGADSGGFRSRTVEHHNYDDSRDNAQALMQEVIASGFRVCKPRANMFIFGDIDLFPFFKKAAASMGWKPFRTPVVWRKSESEGLAPWGREGFRRTYELIFFATKGERGLLQSPVDILDEKRVGRAVRRYGPEKPVGLLEQLIEAATMPNDYILDPCCGAGSTLAAARHLHRRALGIEKELAPYNLAVVAAERDETQALEDIA